MKLSNLKKYLFPVLKLLFVVSFLIYFVGCSINTTAPTQMTDDQYLQQVITAGFDTSRSNEDNLMVNERYDMNDSIAVPDQGNGPLSPIDTLLRWGRKVESVNVQFQITTSSDDSVKTVNITRTITGHYVIIGISNGQLDSVNKPYTEVLYRAISFKRINHLTDPRFNWRVYQVSLLSGGTTAPQNGSMAQLEQIQITVDNNPPVIWNGPDFTQNKFTTLRFQGAGIPHVAIGSTVVVTVTVNSTEATNIVAWHWARNTFGFHRVPFTFVSSTPHGNGTYDNVYQKTFTVYPSHRLGCFNGYINASTMESLYDDDISKFASSEVGIPYRVTAQ